MLDANFLVQANFCKLTPMLLSTAAITANVTAMVQLVLSNSVVLVGEQPLHEYVAFVHMGVVGGVGWGLNWGGLLSIPKLSTCNRAPQGTAKAEQS